MPWYYYVAHFFAGAFLANGVPHFVQGTCGSKFQSPFASPPGVGESSAIVNVVWGWFNFVIAGVLVLAILPPLPPLIGDCVAIALGALGAAMWLRQGTPVAARPIEAAVHASNSQCRILPCVLRVQTAPC